MASILTAIKQQLGGIEESDTSFDSNIIMDINTALLTIKQIGGGNGSPLIIQDKTTEWSDLFEVDETLSAIMSYVFYSVKLSFDPPQSSFVIVAIKEQMSEAAWRIRSAVEGVV